MRAVQSLLLLGYVALAACARFSAEPDVTRTLDWLGATRAIAQHAGIDHQCIEVAVYSPEDWKQDRHQFYGEPVQRFVHAASDGGRNKCWSIEVAAIELREDEADILAKFDRPGFRLHVGFGASYTLRRHEGGALTVEHRRFLWMH